MKTNYDPAIDALYVRFAETRGPISVRKGGNDQNRETLLQFTVFVFGFLERAS